jgi:hypothetical protein
MKEVKGAADIISAVATSSQVEVNESGTKIRRKGSKPVPELSASSKKRDAKAGDKEEQKDEKTSDALPALDERGNPLLSNADFENPIIIHFKTPVTTDDFKVSWKDVEQTVRKQFPRLKIVYSRADTFEGDLALSSHRLHSAELDQLTSEETLLTIQSRAFSFTKTQGEELKAFW